MPTQRCGTLTILSGQNASNTIKAREAYDDAFAVALYGIDTTDAAITYTIEVSDNVDDAAPTFVTLQVGDPFADAVPALTGKSRTFYELPAHLGFRIKSSANVTANRIWRASKLYGTPGYPLPIH